MSKSGMDYLRTMKFMKRKEEAERVRQLQEKSGIIAPSATTTATAAVPEEQHKNNNNSSNTAAEGTPSSAAAPTSSSAVEGIVVRYDTTFPDAMHALGRRRFGAMKKTAAPTPTAAEVDAEGTDPKKRRDNSNRDGAKRRKR
eukprot:PhM_4_TR321/c0_g1_i1/m.10306